MLYCLLKKGLPCYAALALVAALTYTFIVAAPAGADPDSPFTPEFKLETTSTQAGSPTDLTFTIEKTMNECRQMSIRWIKPGEHEKICVEEYREQNLKKTEINLPNALLADVNAAPYCDPRLVEGDYEGVPQVWECANEDARIGTVEAYVQSCDPLWLNDFILYCFEFFNPPFNEPSPPNIFQIWPGVIYNERPHEGEQGRLVILMPRIEIPEEYRRGNPETPPVIRAYARADLSVKVRDASRGYSASDIGIDAVANDIPDTAMLSENPDDTPAYIPGQLQKIKLTIDGDTGSDRGHPLLDNPRICSPQELKTDVQGYAFNSFFEIEEREEGLYFLTTPGQGDGKTESFSVPYQSTGCEKLPYAPNFDISASSYKAGTSPAITTTVSQSSDQATNKKIEVDIPAGINIASTTVPCPADQLASGNCPAESVLGTATAYSRFIPENEGGSLTGNLYLSEIEGSNFKLALQLRGFVDFNISGTAGIVDDKLRVTFDDLPPVPMDRLDLNLKEGNQSLLALPNKCGTHDVVASFTSHTGKTHTATSPLDVTGCGKPSFEVELSNRGRGKRTSLDLDVATQGENIKSVTFSLPRSLKINEAKLGRASYGTITTVSDRGTLERKLRKGKRAQGINSRSKSKSKKKGALRLDAGTSLGSFTASIFKNKVVTHKTIKVRGKKQKKRALKQRIALKKLPTDSLSRVEVMLNPDEKGFIRNPRPKACKKKLKFLAHVKTNRNKYVVKRSVKLKCGEKKG